MINLEKLAKKQNDYIKNLELDDLQKYLDNLAKEYYNTIINNDKVKFNAVKSNLINVLKLHKDKNLDLYVLYTLNNAFNEILINSVDNDLDLNLVKIEKPAINNDNGFYVRKTKLDGLIAYIRDKQTEKAMQEFYNKNPSYDDFLELFNYKDYVL